MLRKRRINKANRAKYDMGIKKNPKIEKRKTSIERLVEVLAIKKARISTLKTHAGCDYDLDDTYENNGEL